MTMPATAKTARRNWLSQLPGRLYPHRLYARLSLALLGLFLVTGAAYLALVLWSAGRYYEEITQRLNQSLAMYIAQRQPLLQHGQVNRPAMEELAHLVMTVNPIVEVYLLDTQGKIIAHALPANSVLRQQVDLAPIRAALAGSSTLPLRGDDPRQADGRKVFSVFPVTDGAHTAGYLYVILGGQAYQSLAASLRGSYILQSSLGGIGLILIVGVAAAALIFALLTRPLRRLASQLNRFRRDEMQAIGDAYPDIQNAVTAPATTIDELQFLQQSFEDMQQRIRDQFQRLQDTDRVRRELISNVSHDLRTPLASMQGYLETLLLKDSQLDGAQRRQYVSVAHRHCQRLTQLVQELFELSKLDAGRVQPNWESFSLAELLQDVAQKFELQARRKDIQLQVVAGAGLYPVCADIALIERVLENLIDNALRYTPQGGRVDLQLQQNAGQVDVQVADSGVGVPAGDLPHIFERYYRGRNPVVAAGAEADDSKGTGTGLGLAIVKRILELHGSCIEVSSQPLQGTCFRFPLPQQPQRPPMNTDLGQPEQAQLVTT